MRQKTPAGEPNQSAWAVARAGLHAYYAVEPSESFTISRYATSVASLFDLTNEETNTLLRACEAHWRLLDHIDRVGERS